MESVLMGAIFHNYKQLLQITKEEDITIDEESLKDDLESLLETLRKQNPVLQIQ